MCDLGAYDSGVVLKLVGELYLSWSLDVYLSIYVNLDLASLISLFVCSLLMYACRLRIAPTRVPVGIMLSQYGVV